MFCRDRKKLQRGTKRKTRLHPLTELVCTNVIAHELILGWPLKVVVYHEICLHTTTMPTNRCVVVFIHDSQLHITMIGYEDTRLVAGSR